jgi:hypothetical protein
MFGGKTMRKILLLVLIILTISGCGGGSDSGSGSPGGGNPITGNSISISVYDKSTSQPLTGVSLTVLETNQIITITNPTSINLSQGNYTLYLSCPGYISRGYIIDSTSSWTINVYLTPENSIGSPQATISGRVLDESGNDYHGSFNICAGTIDSPNFSEEISSSPQYTVTSTCGNIAVSAYTKVNKKIKYTKTSLNWEGVGTTLSNFDLQLPMSTTNYSGSKPGSDLLIVKQNEGYYLAMEQTPDNNYSFGVELIPGNSITLESSKSDSSGNYFTRVNAGSMSGIVDIQYQNNLPNCNISFDGNYYHVSFNQLSFASYYEIDVRQPTIDGDEKSLFDIVNLGVADVKIPKNLFGSYNGSVNIHFRAVNLTGFDKARLLDNTQSFQNYSYTEKVYSLNLATNLTTNSLQTANLKTSAISNTIVKPNYRLKYLSLE